ncbi:limbic system-associated membrane protein-like [Bacillus rossius redtenbacheri]|uniref:limbic system-associated membrane protein-like n=1 Tax=Bacillus rossius redtenbacheri TaxID=93214 RepID=UPI002FDE67E9
MSASVSLLCMALLLAGTAGGQQQPKFRSVPTTVKTSRGDTVMLPCYVENLGGSTVRWWRGQRLLFDSGNRSAGRAPARLKVLGNYTLQVSHLGPDDTGEYRCQVLRPGSWGPLQQVHAIEVLYPPSVRRYPEDGELVVQYGDLVDMRCDARGVPQPIITWLTKGQELRLLDNRPRLRFKADNRSLSGPYTCVAINGVGEPANATIDLRILYPPEVRAERNWVHAAPGIRVELVCHVTADPVPEVEWLFNDRPVNLSSRVVFLPFSGRYSLMLRSVRVTDLGYYTCRAANQMGHSQEIIELSGVANPAVFKTSKLRRPNWTNYTLVWEVDSYNPITEYNLLFRKYRARGKAEPWIRLVIPSDLSPDGPIHSKHYSLSGLTPATVYEAMVISRNRFGWSQPSSILRFATDGPGGETNYVTTDAEIEDENSLPAQVAAILNERSGAETSQLTTCLLLLAMFFTSLAA